MPSDLASGATAAVRLRDRASPPQEQRGEAAREHCTVEGSRILRELIEPSSRAISRFRKPELNQVTGTASAGSLRAGENPA